MLNLKEKNNIFIKELVVEAQSGTSRLNCLKDAMVLAVEEWITTRLIFNDESVVIDPEKLCDMVVKSVEENKQCLPF